MSDPWMKFYPSDWRADPALRMCSLAARGLWAEMMCIMHEAEPYGHLLVNGQPLNEKKLASLSGGGLRETVNALAELDCCGVFSKTEAGVIFSRRMKRDKEKADRDKANGKRGGNPKVMPGVNPEVKAQKPEARDQNPEEENKGMGRSPKATRPDHPQFAEFKKAYPKRKGANPWTPASALFSAAIASGVTAEQMIGALRAGVGFDRDKIGTEFIPRAMQWLKERRYLDHDPTPVSVVVPGFYVAPDTPQMDAWLVYERTGKKYPRDRNGGWHFPSEWPPGHQSEAA